MTNSLVNNNKVNVVGEIVSDFKYSHKSWEKIYVANIALERASGAIDVIPVMIPESLIDWNLNWKGTRVEIIGRFQSHNIHEDNKNKCQLYIFAKKISETKEQRDDNRIYAEGYICKKPTYRETPLGRRISDVFIAINRPGGKSDYIPCICWERNAIFASGMDVGRKVRIGGRIQSRNYLKDVGQGEHEIRVAYEISVNRIDLIQEMGH